MAPETPPAQQPSTVVEDDDEPDEWDKRIEKTGCSGENARLTDCYADGRDWRKCTTQMAELRECWARMKNDARTELRK
ncbi:uncharacterized protein V1518DRAFT_281165 [Limtongia smithiae]|uniref:uncharacterized protein n=1 Tax=Limtongia smithiae TaxID=1125753 RepID=UPI0034CE0519